MCTYGIGGSFRQDLRPDDGPLKQASRADFLDWLDAPKGFNWVEVGCGNGAFTEQLIARNAPVVSAIEFVRRPAEVRVHARGGEARAIPPRRRPGPTLP
jgi:tRNA G46 methylase TrmB